MHEWLGIKKLSEYRCGDSATVARKGAVFEHAELKVGYSISIDHLGELSFEDLEKWKLSIDKCQKPTAYPLDQLYRRIVQL